MTCALCGSGQTQPSTYLVERLQRTLKNGCGEWGLEVDGMLGPETLGAYRRCWTAYGFPEAERLGQAQDIEAFTEEMWHRKWSLILLHSWDTWANVTI